MEGREKFQLDPFSFQQIDKERALLIDHVGACERILKTPLPIVYSIKIRRFIMLFLVTLPFALLHKMDIDKRRAVDSEKISFRQNSFKLL